MHTEADILTLLKAKDEAALSCLYDEYAPALYGIIIKIIPDVDAANNVLHESFIKIWLNIACYKASKGSLFNWMISITVKECHEASGLQKNELLHKLKPARRRWGFILRHLGRRVRKQKSGAL